MSHIKLKRIIDTWSPKLIPKHYELLLAYITVCYSFSFHEKC